MKALRSRFRSVALHDQVHYAGSAIGGPPAAGIASGTRGGGRGPRSVRGGGEQRDVPALEPRASFEEITDLHALAYAVSRWEERARGAEAEVAAMRWELRIAGEKLTALIQRLLEFENAPSRRLRRRLKGEPGRYSADDAAGRLHWPVLDGRTVGRERAAGRLIGGVESKRRPEVGGRLDVRKRFGGHRYFERRRRAASSRRRLAIRQSGPPAPLRERRRCVAQTPPWP